MRLVAPAEWPDPMKAVVNIFTSVVFPTAGIPKIPTWQRRSISESPTSSPDTSWLMAVPMTKSLGDMPCGSAKRGGSSGLKPRCRARLRNISWTAGATSGFAVAATRARTCGESLPSNSTRM